MRKRNSANLLWSCLAVAFLVLPLLGAPGDLDANFAGTGKLRHGFGFGNDEATAMAIDVNHKMVVAGTVEDGARILIALARYETTGALDTSFGAGGKVTTFLEFFDRVVALRIQNDGKIVAAVRTLSDVALIRYNPDGSLDTSFDGDGKVVTDFSNGSDDSTTAMIIQTDGKIVVTAAVSIGAPYEFGILRYNTNGSLDSSFGINGKVITSVGVSADRPEAIALQDDGKILVAGSTLRSSSSSVKDFAIVRYLSSGLPDTSFDGDGIVVTPFGNSGAATAIAFEKGDGTHSNPDRIVVGGETLGSTNWGFAAARYTTSGALDTTFNTTGKANYFVPGVDCRTRAMLTEGTTAAAHKVILAGATSVGAIVRFTSSGAGDTTFDGDGLATFPGSTVINAMSFQGLAIGVAGLIPSLSNDFGMARYLTNGALDTTFDGDGIRRDDFGNVDAIAKAVAVQTDGKIVVAGASVLGATVVRYNSNGTLDTSFATNGVAVVATNAASANGIVIQPDGKIVTTGDSGGSAFVARLNVNGAFDSSFDGDGIATFLNTINPNAVAIQADGKIVVAGNWNSGVAVLRLNSIGTPDTSFDADGIVNTPVGSNSGAAAVAIQTDGKIVVAGSSTSVGNTDFVVIRYSVNGSPDATFAGDGIVTANFGSGEDRANALSIQADGKILASGYTFNGSDNDFATIRLSTNGFPDTDFDGDGKVTTSFGSGADTASSMRIQSDGKILVAGTSQNQQSQDDFSMVRYNTNGSLDSSYGTGGKVTTDFVGSNDSSWQMALDSRERAVIVGEAASLFGVTRILGDLGAGGLAPFDFDGDGRTDIGIFRPADGRWWYSRSSDSAIRVYTFGVATDLLAPADFTGDGKTDIVVFRPSSGTWFIQRSEDSTYYSFPFGAVGDIPTPADFDGDGKADAAVFRPSTGTWFIQNSGGSGTSIIGFGTAEDRPVAADYDGDGRADIAIFRPSNGTWWRLQSSDSQVRVFTFGVSTDKTVPGDYTGDGKADIAIFRPSTGVWYVQRSEDNSYYSVPFGTSGDLPVPGDYDGDGKFDTAVFRPSTNNWFVQRSTAGILILQFGASGDRPVPGAYVR